MRNKAWRPIFKDAQFSSQRRMLSCHLMQAFKISIPLWKGRHLQWVGVGLSRLWWWRVFVEVDRLASASRRRVREKRLILLGITGSTLGDARQLPIPISLHRLPSFPPLTTPPKPSLLLLLPCVSTNPLPWIDPQRRNHHIQSEPTGSTAQTKTNAVFYSNCHASLRDAIC